MEASRFKSDLYSLVALCESRLTSYEIRISKVNDSLFWVEVICDFPLEGMNQITEANHFDLEIAAKICEEKLREWLAKFQ